MNPFFLLVLAGLFCFSTSSSAQNTSPQQRRQEALQRLEKTLRDTMNWCEMTDKPMQDAVVQCAVAQDEALQPVREAHRKVAQALVDKQAGNAQFSTLLNDWRAAVEDAKEKRKNAITKLQAQSDFVRQPKLESFLTITGLLGDEAGFLINPEGHLLSVLGTLATPPAK